MGRLLLSVAVLAALVGCAPEGGPGDGPTGGSAGSAMRATGALESAHAGFACATCHTGDVSGDRELAVAGREGCTASGCHEDAGPFTVRTAGTVEFTHRDHPTPWDASMSCATCHGHEQGSEPLVAGTDGCALCHAEQLSGDEPSDCRMCHTSLPRVVATNLGVGVPHDPVTQLETGCVRCHFEVAQVPPIASTTRSCLACHEIGADEDLGDGDPHEEHVDMSCSSCHERTVHEVLGMSSSIDLQCADCHTRSHGEEPAELPPNAVCTNCHTVEHRPQQRLFLGLTGDEGPLAPSMKFLAGLTCSSCHVAHSDPETTVGSGDSCVACHTSEYTKVLDWWKDGGDRRFAAVESYLLQTRAAVGESGELDRAWERLDLVRDGGVHHGIDVLDRLLRSALADGAEAYRGQNMVVPPAPELGSRPRLGLCAMCHFDPEGEFDLGDMPDDFHREVMRSR